MNTKLQTPIDYLKGVGPHRADLLRKELGIQTYQDLLNFFPYRYIDRTRFYQIKDLQRHSAEVQLVGEIIEIKEVAQKRGKRLVAKFRDETGTMELVWFRGQKWIKNQLKLHVPYIIFGKTNWYNNSFSMPHPEMELKPKNKKELKTGMKALYSSTEKLNNSGITNKVMTGMIQHLFLELKELLFETLPEYLINKEALLTKDKALLNIHFPKTT